MLSLECLTSRAASVRFVSYIEAIGLKLASTM